MASLKLLLSRACFFGRCDNSWPVSSGCWRGRWSVRAECIMAAGCHGTVRSMLCCLCRNLVLARVHEVVLVFVACRRRLVQWEVVLWGPVTNKYVRGRDPKPAQIFQKQGM